jgi:hypothetical protein
MCKATLLISVHGVATEEDGPPGLQAGLFLQFPTHREFGVFTWLDVARREAQAVVTATMLVLPKRKDAAIKRQGAGYDEIGQDHLIEVRHMPAGVGYDMLAQDSQMRPTFEDSLLAENAPFVGSGHAVNSSRFGW